MSLPLVTRAVERSVDPQALGHLHRRRRREPVLVSPVLLRVLNCQLHAHDRFALALTLGIDSRAVERGEELDFVSILLVVADVATGGHEVGSHAMDLRELLLRREI